MPSLGDSAFIFVLALLLFGPKKLPELARQLGKLMGEFRRASNEFRMQMEDELRISEQAERQKEIAAIQAAAPVTPAIDPGPNTIAATPALEASTDVPRPFPEVSAEEIADPLETHPHMPPPAEVSASTEVSTPVEAPTPASEPLPIANSGSLRIRPPKTGMPFAQSIGMAPSQPTSRVSADNSAGALSPLFDSIPQDTSPEVASAEPVSSNEASHRG